MRRPLLPLLMWGMLLAGAGVRLFQIHMPILEVSPTRQVQTAMIARNFFAGGIDLLYPRVDYFGSGRDWFVLEFPWYNAAVAIGYHVIGGVHEWLGRVLSIICWAVGGGVLWRLVSRRLGELVGVGAVAVWTLSPLSIVYSRAFMPESLLMLLTLICVERFDQWCRNERWRDWGLSLISFAAALMIKPHVLFLAIPCGALAWSARGRRMLTEGTWWIWCLASVVPATWWFSRATELAYQYPSTVLSNFQPGKWFHPSLLFDGSFYGSCLRFLAGVVLTPLGLLLMVFGMWVTRRLPSYRWVFAWLGGVALYTILFNTHTIDHDYYHLHWLPVAGVFIGAAFQAWSSAGRDRRVRLAAGIACLVMGSGLSLRLSRHAWQVPLSMRHAVEAGRVVQQATSPHALVVSAGTGPGGLYYCHRKGWTFLIQREELPPHKYYTDPVFYLEYLRRRGAQFLVIAFVPDFLAHERFQAHVRAHYPVVVDQPGQFLIFDLTRRLATP